MRNTKKQVLGIGFGLLTLITGILGPRPVKSVWLHLSGGVMPNALRTQGYTDKPFTILSVKGQKWTSWNKLEAGSAYHALIILPQILPNDGDSGTRSDGFTYTATEKWQSGKAEANTGPTEEELAISYDALRQTITVGSETYHLAKGNLFVVRLDENWHPEITQLEMTNNKDIGVEEVISAFKSALRQDRIVQQLGETNGDIERSLKGEAKVGWNRSPLMLGVMR